jgi:hypothetical protein
MCDRLAKKLLDSRMNLTHPHRRTGQLESAPDRSQDGALTAAKTPRGQIRHPFPYRYIVFRSRQPSLSLRDRVTRLVTFG